MVEQEAFDNRFTGKLVAEAVLRLFEEDGTLYLTTGYLTWSGYLTIRDSLIAFLSRSPSNRVNVVVSTGADQFSRGVARDIWSLGFDDRCRLLTYRDGFIHPKLYLRDGDDPAFVMGSANLTWDGLGKNLEFAWYYRPDDPDDSIFRSHLDWVIGFVSECEPITEADLVPSARLRRTADTWLSKGRINLPSMIAGAIPFRRRQPAVDPTLSVGRVGASLFQPPEDVGEFPPTSERPQIADIGPMGRQQPIDGRFTGAGTLAIDDLLARSKELTDDQ